MPKTMTSPTIKCGVRPFQRPIMGHHVDGNPRSVFVIALALTTVTIETSGGDVNAHSRPLDNASASGTTVITTRLVVVIAPVIVVRIAGIEVIDGRGNQRAIRQVIIGATAGESHKGIIPTQSQMSTPKPIFATLSSLHAA